MKMIKVHSYFPIRLESDSNEMDHAAYGLGFLWQHLPPEKLLHEESDITNLSFRCALRESGITPCLLVNLGSALTISEVKRSAIYDMYIVIIFTTT